VLWLKKSTSTLFDGLFKIKLNTAIESTPPEQAM